MREFIELELRMPRTFFPALFGGRAAGFAEFRELQQLASPVYFRSGATVFVERTKAKAAFDKLAHDYPKSDAARRIPRTENP